MTESELQRVAVKAALEAGAVEAARNGGTLKKGVPHKEAV
jgi:hypothetical protein